MGSKGSQTTTNTAQNQTYSANPAVAAAGTQALNMAQGAASQPFQMPVAPVAGFNQDQQGAFDAYRNMQGSFNPYAQQAANAFGQSATPITAGDVSQYYNPMVDSVTRQMQNIFGQQNSQNTGNLVQSAGGIGADRIAVGQANMANQQGLAAGQTYAGLYQQALQQAQQQKQMEAGAGSGFLNTGTALNQANLANTNAYLQSGQLQQQQAQAQLNAPYQNKLAQIAYPFQTAQYLAGITGSLAPTFGGTTMGVQNGVTTPPQPSMLSQIAGVGTAGAGLYGALNGGFGSNIYSPSNLADPGNSLNGISDSQAAQYENLYGNRGGATPFADGGDVSPSRGDPEEPRQIAVQTQAPPDIHPLIGGAMARRGMAHLPESHHDMMATTADTIYNRRGLHRADGGGADDTDVSFPGISKSEAADLTPIPLSPMHNTGGGGHSGPLTGAMSFPSPQQQQGKSDSVLGDVANIAGSVAKIAPLFMLARGGVASYGSGGGDDSFYSPDETGPSPLVDWASNTSAVNWLANNKKRFDETPPPAGRVSEPTPSFSDRFGAAFRGNGANAVTPAPTPESAQFKPLPADGPGIYQRAHDYWLGPAAAKPAPTTVAEANPSPVAPGTIPLPKAFPGGPSREQVANAYRMPGNVKAEPAEAEETFVMPKSRDSSPAQIQRAMMPTSQQPYPDALDRDWGQQAARSPWMALVTAGAKMASTPGPLGVSIGQGLQAGVGTLDNQRKELTTEQGLNQKAQALYQTAKAELDKYSKMTPYEQGSLMLRNKEADQSGATGNGFKSYIQARRLAESEIHKRAQNDPVYTMQHDTAKEIEALTQQIMQHAGAGTGAAAVPASTANGPPANPKPGDTFLFNAGLGKWDGTKWVPAGT